MKTTNLRKANGAKSRHSLRRRRQHDPMLVLSMSIFNSADGWNRVFNPVRRHENAWC